MFELVLGAAILKVVCIGSHGCDPSLEGRSLVSALRVAFVVLLHALRSPIVLIVAATGMRAFAYRHKFSSSPMNLM